MTKLTRLQMRRIPYQNIVTTQENSSKRISKYHTRLCYEVSYTAGRKPCGGLWHKQLQILGSNSPSNNSVRAEQQRHKSASRKLEMQIESKREIAGSSNGYPFYYCCPCSSLVTVQVLWKKGSGEVSPEAIETRSPWISSEGLNSENCNPLRSLWHRNLRLTPPFLPHET